jgi:hypothetical protein
MMKGTMQQYYNPSLFFIAVETVPKVGQNG